MDKPGIWRWSHINLQGAQKPPHCLEHCQWVAAAEAFQPETAVVLRCIQTCWKELNTKSKGGMMTYHLSSSQHLCSAMSPGCELNCPSNATTCKRRSSILLPIIVVLCRCVCQGRILIRVSKANFEISIDGRDCPQDSFERTKSFCCFFCGIDGNGNIPKQCTLTGYLCDWLMLQESQRHHCDNTYLSMPPLARLFSLQYFWYSHLMRGGMEIRMNISCNRRDQKTLTCRIVSVASTTDHSTGCHTPRCRKLLVNVHPILRKDLRTPAASLI